MSLKSFLRELKEMKYVIGNIARGRMEGKHWLDRTHSHIASDVVPSESTQQGKWANLPPELLLDILQRVEESGMSWPSRKAVVFCGSVCKSWREIMKEIVKTTEECGRLTFPISLKQPGPRDAPIQCFIKRDRSTSTYRLYLGLTPSENSNKLLLAAKKIRRATSTEYMISLAVDDFSRASNTYLGKLRSNFLGTKFTIYDSQPPNDAAVRPSKWSAQRLHAKKASPKVRARSYSVATISYEFNVLCTRGPRKMHCVVESIPVSSIQEGGTAPTPTSFAASFDEKHSPPPVSKGNNNPVTDFKSPSIAASSVFVPLSKEPLMLKNRAPRWHEQLQCWCLNFKGRVTVASVKNFQLVASIDPPPVVSTSDKEKVILQFGKIGKEVFSMDYCYPISAFQAFAICLSSFGSKPICE